MMKETIEEHQFDEGETVSIHKLTRECFVVELKSSNGKFSREQKFTKYPDAEDFYDTFTESKQVRDYINEMISAYGLSV